MYPKKLFKSLLSHVLDYKFSNNTKSPPDMLCYHSTSLILVVSHNLHNSEIHFFKKMASTQLLD